MILEEVIKLCFDVTVHGFASDGNIIQGGQIHAVQFLLVQHCLAVLRDGVDNCHIMEFMILMIFSNLIVGNQTNSHSHSHSFMNTIAEAVVYKRRKYDEHAFAGHVLVTWERKSDLERDRVFVGIRKHASFRFSGCAASMGNDSHGSRILADIGRSHILSVFQKLSPGHAHGLVQLGELCPFIQRSLNAVQRLCRRDDDGLLYGGLFQRIFDDVIGAVEHEEEAAFRLIQITMQLFFTGKRMDQIHDRTHTVHSISQINKLWCIRHSDSYDLTGLHAKSSQSLCCFFNMLPEFTISDFLHVHVFQSDSIGPILVGFVNILKHGLAGQLCSKNFLGKSTSPGSVNRCISCLIL